MKILQLAALLVVVGACSSEAIQASPWYAEKATTKGSTVSTADTCPGVEPPVVGTTCTARPYSAPDWNGTCEYGHDLDRACNAIYECLGVWTTPVYAPCHDRCPAAFDAIRPGAECSDTAAACSYLEGTCACIAGESDAGADAGASHWQCAPPPGGACPAQRPVPGTTCVTASNCDYGSCALGRKVAFACDGDAGTWTTGTPAACP